jgi:hypothetical protein
MSQATTNNTTERIRPVQLRRVVKQGHGIQNEDSIWRCGNCRSYGLNPKARPVMSAASCRGSTKSPNRPPWRTGGMTGGTSCYASTGEPLSH